MKGWPWFGQKGYPTGLLKVAPDSDGSRRAAGNASVYGIHGHIGSILKVQKKRSVKQGVIRDLTLQG